MQSCSYVYCSLKAAPLDDRQVAWGEVIYKTNGWFELRAWGWMIEWRLDSH
jgi:hypothetical protein